MNRWRQEYPAVVADVRGKGLLLLAEFCDEETAARIAAECLSRRVFVRQTQGNGIRVFPALNIERGPLMDGLAVIREAIETEAKEKR